MSSPAVFGPLPSSSRMMRREGLETALKTSVGTGGVYVGKIRHIKFSRAKWEWTGGAVARTGAGP